MDTNFVIQLPTNAQVLVQTKCSLLNWSYEKNNEPHFKMGQFFFKLQGRTCSMVLKDVASIALHVDQLPNQFFKP